MFSIVTSTSEFQLKKQKELVSSLTDQYRFVEYVKYADALEKLMIEARGEYLKSNYNNNKEKNTKTPKEILPGSGFFEIRKSFYNYLKEKLQSNQDLRSMWDALGFNENYCPIYPMIFSNSPTVINEHEIDLEFFRKELIDHILEKMPWITKFIEAESIITENKDKEALYVFYNNSSLNLLEIKSNYNKIYSWEKEKVVTFTFRSPHNIEYIKTSENENYLFHKLKVFRIDAPFTIVWPKSHGKSGLEELLYAN